MKVNKVTERKMKTNLSIYHHFCLFSLGLPPPGMMPGQMPPPGFPPQGLPPPGMPAAPPPPMSMRGPPRGQERTDQVRRAKICHLIT